MIMDSLQGHPRLALAGLIALALAVPAGGATAKPKPPPKPPPPKLDLLTGTERGVLRRGEIKIAVEAKRAKSVTVSAVFTVDGFPDDYVFNLGPKRESVADGDALARERRRRRRGDPLPAQPAPEGGARLRDQDLPRRDPGHHREDRGADREAASGAEDAPRLQQRSLT
jgi:hypothetical protein